MKYFKPEFEIIMMDNDVICASSGGLDWNEDLEGGDIGNMDDLE